MVQILYDKTPLPWLHRPASDGLRFIAAARPAADASRLPAADNFALCPAWESGRVGPCSVGWGEEHRPISGPEYRLRLIKSAYAFSLRLAMLLISPGYSARRNACVRYEDANRL